MKQTILIFIAAFFLTIQSQATEYIILAEGTTIPTDVFTPSVTYAVVGDTITWIWVEGVHTTESVDIPQGAASWSSNLDNSTTTFSYVVTVPGSYYYDCHASFSHGMDGWIEVTAPTGVFETEPMPGFKVYPNPAMEFTRIEGEKFNRIEVYGITGALAQTFSFSNSISSREISTKGLKPGTYFLHLYEDGKQVGTDQFVKR
jgi:plastocyanin